MTDIKDTIIDVTKPNAGRIYDYWLGGHTNYDVDREAGDAIKKINPNVVKIAKLIRWFLGVGIRKTVEWGFTQFIDFASGLPTVDHIHVVAPQGAKVIYSDIDPVTIQIGKDIIKDNPVVKYEMCNAATPEKLLNSEVVKSLIGNDHKIAFGFNGICYFLTDEQISHAMKVLYDWADEGSILFLTDFDGVGDQSSEESKKVFDMYKNMKQPIYIRSSKEDFIELVKPWKIKEPGFRILEEWLNWEPEVTNEFIKRWGGGGLFSGFMYK